MSDKMLRHQMYTLRRGNTLLIEALMDMASEYCRSYDNDGTCEANGSVTNANTLMLLERAGYAKSEGLKYTLLWDRLKTRMTDLNLTDKNYA